MLITIGQRIREMRKKHNMSQQMLADFVGVSNTAIANYELDVREPSNEVLVRLAANLRCTTDYLCGLEKEPSAKLGQLTEEQSELVYRLIDIFIKDNKKK